MFSELNISANLAMLSPPGCPIFQPLAGLTRMPQAMEFIYIFMIISHGGHLTDKRGRKALRWEEVSGWGQGRNEFASRRSSELFWCLSSSFPHFFPSKTLPFIICRSLGAPWTELPVGLNAPKRQIEPEVSVWASAPSPRHLLLFPGSRGWQDHDWFITVLPRFSPRKPIPACQAHNISQNTATQPAPCWVEGDQQSTGTSPCHQQPKEEEAGDGCCAPPA